MPNFMELLKESSMKHWSTTGPERLVKVVSPAGRKSLLEYDSVMGYVTQEKYLIGKTALQIESALGLRPFELRNMCYVYSMARLPERDEIEFKLNCAFPDGNVFDDTPRKADGKTKPSLMNEAMTARKRYLNHQDLYGSANTPVSYTPIMNYYPPGSSQVLQWKLTAPVPLGSLISTVTNAIPLSKQYPVSGIV